MLSHMGPVKISAGSLFKLRTNELMILISFITSWETSLPVKVRTPIRYRNGSYDPNPVKVRVEATSAFKQLTLTDHARGRGAVGEPARPGGADDRSAFVYFGP
jgi:hypothetical protein